MKKNLLTLLLVLSMVTLVACSEDTVTNDVSKEEKNVDVSTELDTTAGVADVMDVDGGVTSSTSTETTEVSLETEPVVAEPSLNYTEDAAFTIEQNMPVDGIVSVDIKTITDFEVIPSNDKDFETGEPAYYMYQTTNGTELKFNVGPMYTPESGTNETSTYTNADGVEIIYQITDISNYLYMPLNEEGMYVRIKVTPVDTENFNIQDYLEITRSCYYNINRE